MINLRSRILLWCFIVAATTLMLVDFAQAQTISYGKLTGTILDETGQPLPGVTVEITSDALITGQLSTNTSGKGTYVFISLPVGKYNLRAKLEGFMTAVQENIAISAGSVITVDLTMKQGSISEEIIVTAAAPVVDAKSSTISTSIESELMNKMPTSRDAFYDLSLTAPGMVSHGEAGVGGGLPSPNAYGSTTNENVFLINGVNTTSPRASSYGSLVQVNYNAVEEVRIIALGSKAEYGSFSGVAIDVLTKSGSNALHGNASFYSLLGKSANNQPEPADLGKLGDKVDMYIQTNPHKLDPVTKKPVPEEIQRKNIKELEGNFTLGGPIIKDKIWFYGGVDYIRSETDVPIFKVNSNWYGRFGDLKISAAPWSNHRAWIAYHYESNDSKGGTWENTWDGDMNYNMHNINNSVSAQWQWSASGKTLLTAKYLGFWADDRPSIPDNHPPQSGYVNWWKWMRFGVNGHFPYVEAQKSSRQTFQTDVSHYAENFLGEHDIKFGVQYTRGRSNWLGGYFHGYANFAYPLRWTQYISQATNWYGDTGMQWYVWQFHTNPFLTVRTSDQLGFFMDDQWNPTKRLTINLGLRYDKMIAKYGTGKMYEQPSDPNAFSRNELTAISDRKGTNNIFDIGTWAPRIGITYALTSDMKTIFRASYGRYFYPISAEFLRRFGPDLPAFDRKWVFYQVPWNLVDTNNNGYIDDLEVEATARLLHGNPQWIYNSYWEKWDRSWQLNVAKNLKDQHTDQFTVNLERELFSDFSASVTYLYKRTSDIFANWPLNRVTGTDWEYTKVPYTTSYGKVVQLYNVVWKDYNGDGLVNGDDLTWIRSHIDYRVQNTPELDGKKPHRTYQGLQFVFKKRYSNRWQMLSSFLYSTSDGMAARAIRQDFNFEGPMVMDTTWIEDLNYAVNSMEGPLPFTQKYEFKLSGSYKIPGIEADLGFRFRFNSGRPLWPVESAPGYATWMGSSPPPNTVVTLSGGARIPAIDSKDPWYLPSEKILDLRVGKDFKLGGYGSLNLAVDVLNVFNEAIPTGVGEGYIAAVGRVKGVTYPSRKIRLSLRYDF